MLWAGGQRIHKKCTSSLSSSASLAVSLIQSCCQRLFFQPPAELAGDSPMITGSVWMPRHAPEPETTDATQSPGDGHAAGFCLSCGNLR